MVRLTPSVLAADFARLDREIADSEAAGVDGLHLDIMDGRFVPNLSFGPRFVKTVDRLTDLPLVAHLMLERPEEYFDAFREAGADTIVFHVEARPEPGTLLRRLRASGVGAGLALGPEQDPSSVLPHLEGVDLLLVLSVHPGFGGQRFLESTLRTVEAARRRVDARGLGTAIAVDGGVNEENAGRIAGAGADVLVMGTAFYGSGDRTALTRGIHRIEPERRRV